MSKAGSKKNSNSISNNFRNKSKSKLFKKKLDSNSSSISNLISNSNPKLKSNSNLFNSAKENSKQIGKSLPLGLIHKNNYLNSKDQKQWIDWLTSLHPIWETRYLSTSDEMIKDAENGEKRMLLRPVYWMGNWQFACLGYYQLPNGTKNRCVRAEPFPDFVQEKIDQIESMIKEQIPPAFIPRAWRLNTLLINYYGSPIDPETQKKVDQARLGEHKDHEPGPVASISFGAKTMFQFVSSAHKQASSQVVYQQWLEDNSLFIFSGEKFKNKLFHRVQRVDRKSPIEFKNCNIPNYEVRRINLTFRYVPEDCFVDYKNLPNDLKIEIDPYIKELSSHSDFFNKIAD